ncbi:MAG: T9SS type A sorting domain-containing protein [Calditrichales bacterium]|nr:MAG: T9SS type A sorting domain-containing protein [Calditrichales bacterium]
MRIFSGLLIFLIITLGFAQEITWNEQTGTGLPSGVRLFKGSRATPKLNILYLDVDLNSETVAVRPYISSSVATAPVLTEQFGALAAVNGGFFGGSNSLSSTIYPGEVKSINVKAVTRDGKTYPLLRSLFSIGKSGNPSVDWIYHFDNSMAGIYRFDQPLAYTNLDPTPKPAPQRTDGQAAEDVLLGIGGAPTLVKNSQVQVTYNEEIMWGSGVGYDTRDPRTAVGYTSGNHVIMLVADGRQPAVSEGVGLPELAQIMIDLGCVEAMNLDGGGSTQMAVGDQYVNSPSEYRSVPTILAVVYKDSLNLPQEPQLEKVIDTGDAECQLIGDGWFPTANEGYWGETAALLHTKGSGTTLAEFTVHVEARAAYQVFGWWVAANNRCTDTPVIIHHHNGVDTVRVNQAANGSTWVPLGEYLFSGSDEEKVIISDAATSGTYVVADAIRLVTYDTSGTLSIHNETIARPSRYDLEQNYPNPFNPQTEIRFELPVGAEKYTTRLDIYNALGQRVRALLADRLSAGMHQVQWDGRDSNGVRQSSGIYLYCLRNHTYQQTRKMILMK